MQSPSSSAIFEPQNSKCTLPSSKLGHVGFENPAFRWGLALRALEPAKTSVQEAFFGLNIGPLSKPKLGQSAGKLASKLLDLGGDELMEPTSHASYLYNIVLTALLLP